MRSKSPILALALGATTFIFGCSGDASTRSTGSVSGVVKLGDKAPSAAVIKFAATKTGNAATAKLDADGKYSIDEMVADTYAVTIAPPDPTPGEPGKPNPGTSNPDEIPKKYREAATSGFTAEVKPGKNTFDFTMTP